MQQENDKKWYQTRNKTRKKHETTIQRLACLSSTSILINNDPLGHTLDNFGIKLDSMIPREADLFGQVIRQYIHQIAVSVGVEQRFVCKLGILVAQA